VARRWRLVARAGGSQPLHVSDESLEVSPKPLPHLSDRNTPQHRKTGFGFDRIPGHQRITPTPGEGTVRFGEHAVCRHQRREAPSLLASEHGRANAEPATQLNGSAQLGVRAGEPMHHWHSRPSMRLNVIKDE